MIHGISEWFHRVFNLPYRLHSGRVGEGTPVILLHGLAGSSLNWQKVIARLTDYQCVSVDLLGFGHSPKPLWAAYTADQHVRSIHHTIKRAGIKPPFKLIGHSLGSLLAIRYAALYPQDVSHLYLLSPPIYKGSAESTRAYRRWVETMHDRLYRYLRRHKQFTLLGAKYIVKRLVPNNQDLDLTEHTWVPFVRSLENCIEKQDQTKDLRQLKMPIDLFYGSHDRLLSVVNLKNAADQPNITLHRLPVGHNINQRYALAVVAALNQS